MSEDRFDEYLRHLARGYNEPPETPREELWAAITAARRASRPDPRPGRYAWLGRLGALAAMLALGLGIGRFVAREGGAPSGAVQRGPVAERPAADTPAQPASPLGDSPHGPPPALTRMVVLEQGNDDPAHGERAEVRDGPRFAAEVRARPPARTAPRVAEGARGVWQSGEEQEPNAVYTLVATQTLVQGEALLTTFRTARDPAELDPAVGAWARDVLFATSLLLDSPAGDEPVLRGLLEDLELVLLQIARLSGSPADSAERAWIHETLRQRDMLPRLRTVVPAGPVMGT